MSVGIWLKPDSRLPPKDVNLQRLRCDSCRILWSAVTAILGLYWEDEFNCISLSTGAEDGQGPLRFDVGTLLLGV